MGVVDFGVEFVVDFLGEDSKKTCPKLGVLDGSFGVKAPSKVVNPSKTRTPVFFASKRSADPKTRHFPIPEIL